MKSEPQPNETPDNYVVFCDGDESIRQYDEDIKWKRKQYPRLSREADALKDVCRLDLDIANVVRSDPDVLFSLKRQHFEFEKFVALRHWLRRYRESSWMQRQRYYPQRLSLALSARSLSFDPFRFAYCYPRRRCGYVDLCPRCANEERTQKWVFEFGDSFDKAPVWVALVPCIVTRPAKAGLHIAKVVNSRGNPDDCSHYRRFAGFPELAPLTLEGEMALACEASFRACLRLGTLLVSEGLACGSFTSRECAVSFHPNTDPLASGLLVREEVLPHANILCNMTRPWTDEEHDRAFYLLCGALECEFKRTEIEPWGYPDLFIGKPFPNKTGFKTWLNYMGKAMKFPEAYAKARDQGCNLRHLNLHLDQTVFGGLRTVIGNTRSPVKAGNMLCSSRKLPYIGRRLPNRDLHRIKRKWASCLKLNQGIPLSEFLSVKEWEILAKLDPTHEAMLHRPVIYSDSDV